MMAAVLADDEVHIWYCLTDDPPWADVHAEYLSLLSPDERARHDRFLFDKDRRQFLLARALLRTVLSCYAAPAPGEWEFESTPQGKPYIARRRELPPLQFNYSHADPLVACAIASTAAVGVDVESAGRDVDLRIAKYCLSAVEMERFARLDPCRQGRFLMQHWTLKEAYAKARGLGLSLPFSSVTCHFATEGRPALTFRADATDDPAQWQLQQWLVEGEHFLSLAVARPAVAPCRIIMRRSLPPLDASLRRTIAAPGTTNAGR